MYNFDKPTNRKENDSVKWLDLNPTFGRDNLHPMWVADMDFEAPEFIVNSILEKANEKIFGYTLAPKEYYESAINWRKKRNGHEIERETLLFSPTVLASLNILVKLYTDPGDSIIIQTPVYSPFEKIIDSNNRGILKNPLNRDKEGYYTIDFENFERLASKPNTKAFILCSPHNPLGRVWTREELRKLGDICVKHRVKIISDEIHSDLVFDRNSFVSIASISESIREISAICFSPTKTFNLAGLHTSFVILENEKLRNRFNFYLETYGINRPNPFGLKATISAYTYGDNWVDELNSYLLENIELVDRFLKERLPRVKFLKPEGTYLLWLDISNITKDNELLQKELIKNGLAVNSGSWFVENGDGHIRLNIATQRKQVEIGLDLLEKSLKNL